MATPVNCASLCSGPLLVSSSKRGKPSIAFSKTVAPFCSVVYHRSQHAEYHQCLISPVQALHLNCRLLRRSSYFIPNIASINIYQYYKFMLSSMLPIEAFDDSTTKPILTMRKNIVRVREISQSFT